MRSPRERGEGIVRAKRIVRNARSLEDVPGMAGPAKSLAGFSANGDPDSDDADRMLLLPLHAPLPFLPLPPLTHGIEDGPGMYRHAAGVRFAQSVLWGEGHAL